MMTRAIRQYYFFLAVFIFILCSASAVLAQTFAAAVNYTAGTTPYSVAVGDFNGDGKVDLAVPNFGSNNLSILLGNGTGIFGAPTNFATGAAPLFAAVADLNRDGKLDIVTANWTGNNISVLLGNGDGTFQTAVNYAAGTNTRDVVIVDLNGDGKLDLVVTNNGSNNVGVFLGNGDGTFQPMVTYATGTSPRAVVVADFNKDGKLDLAVSNSGDNTVSILLGNGDGTFQARTNYATGASPWFLTAADFNGDGNLDLAVPNMGGTTVSILLGNGDGTFQAQTTFTVGNAPHTVAAYDFNGDGILDLCVGNTNSNNVSILLGNGNGTFGAATNFAVGTTPTGMFLGDLNSDGKADIAVSNINSNNVSVLLNTTTPFPNMTLTAPATATAGSSFSVTVTVKSGGTTYAAYRGTVHFTSSDGQAVLPANYTFTAADAGVHTFTVTLKTAGSQTVTATDIYNAANTGSATVTVNPAAASTFTFAVPASTNAGSAFNVAVTAKDPYGNVATGYRGTIQFSSSDVQAGLPANYTFTAGDNGIHTFTNGVTLKTAGNQTITTTDTGSSSVTGTSSAIAVSALAANHLSISAPATSNRGASFSITVTAQDLYNNTAISYRGAVSFSSTDGAATLPGSYTFVAGDNGVHTFSGVVLNTAGSQTITSTDGTISGTSNTITVPKDSPVTAVTSSANPSVFGQSVTFTATLSPAPPNGETITFKDGGATLGTGTLSGGVATFATSSLALGSHTITAVYAGDTNFNTSTGTLSPNQVVNKASSSTAVTSSANPSVFGQSVTFTATVTAVAPASGTPTGTVTFKDGATTLGTGTLSSGVATFATSSLALGSHTITAVYAGDTNFNTSTGTLSPNQMVNQASSSTAVSSSANPSVFGQSVTFTATVTAVAPASGTPTGTVTFKDGATTLGTGTLSGGVATFATSSLALGSHVITAVYAGDTNFNTSTGTLSPNQVVNKASSSTAVTSSVNPSVFGQSVTFTATVTAVAPASGTPTGTVTFKDGATTLGTGTLSSGVATFATSSLALGSHTITAVYAGDTNFNTSTGTLSPNQVVNQASSSTAVTSSANPSVFGQSVTFTATVTAVAPASGTPTGTVTFKDGATTLGTVTLSSGVATFATSSLVLGSHTITAVYAGDTNFNTSTGTLSPNQVVNKASSSTAVTSSVNPSVFGQSVTFTATVTAVAPASGTPTGTVTFKDGATTLGTGTLNGSGIATLPISSLAIGSHVITAVYAGDTNFNTSTGTLSPNQVVNQASSSTAVSSSANPSVFGQSVTFTATVTAVAPASGTPTGTVTFKDGATTLGTATLNGSGVATLPISSLAIGSHVITAVYNGDTNFTTSTGTLSPNQVVNQASSSTAVTSSANPSVFGQSVTFTATVTAVAPASGTPTGTVTFKDGATTLGTGTLSSGVATFATSSLALGSHVITAVYAGDTNFNTSTGTLSPNQVVNKASSSTAVTSSANPSVFGQSVTFTATVTAAAPASGTPTGTVTFKDGATTLGTGTLSSGVATFATSSLALGSHTITAVYAGDTNFNTSTGTLSPNQVVNQASSSTAVSSSANPSVFGQSVMFTATVTAVAPASGTPTGTVTFKDGATTLGTGTLSSGVATLATSSFAIGSHTITAVYAGDTNFNTGTGSLTQVVNQASTTTGVTSSANPSAFGQSVAFTATVTAVAPASGTPTGTVTFQDGGSNIGTSTLNGSGVATLMISSLTAGNHTITAVYGGDTSFNTSTGSLTQVVNQASSSTTLASSPNPSGSGQSVTFTATVAAVAPASSTPTGTVTFKDGSTTLGTGTLSAGSASFSTSALSNGNHSITAVYSGDTNFAGSTSTVLTQTVKTSTTTAVASSANPSLSGTSVTFTATVTPSSATGTVNFFDGGSNIGSGTLSGGMATFATSSLTLGNHTITAVYVGDANDLGSTSPVLVQAVKASTTASVSSAVNPSVFGQSVTFTATIIGQPPANSTPSGTVTFMDGATTLGTGTLSGSGVTGQATFSTSALSVSGHSITAVYNGDSTYLGSTSSVLTQTVNQASTSTAITNSSLNPSTYGQSVTFTASVTVSAPGAGTPTGTVTFKDGSTVLGTGTVNGSGLATLMTNAVVAGNRTITAVYGGDSSFTASTSAGFLQQVNQASTNTTLSASTSSSVYGQPVTFTATVIAIAPGSGTPTSTVQFMDGTNPLGSPVALNGSGQAQLVISTLALGAHPISVVYGGDTNFVTSTSNTVVETVNQASSSAAVASSVNPSVYGQAVTFTATITPVAPSTGIPTGTVTFKDNNIAFAGGTVAVDNTGHATLTPATLSVGSHSITIVYSGDTNYSGSNGSLPTQTVNMASTTLSLASSANPSNFGQSVTFTATVAAVAPGAGTPTGTVTFLDGGSNIGTGTLNGSGVATFATSTLSVGNHTITASYASDGNFNSSSNSLPGNNPQVISQSTTTTALASSLNPSVYGQSVTFTATVTPSTATGTVTFMDGTTTLGTITLTSGTASLPISALAVGSHTITAVYNGDSNFTGSTGSLSSAQVVNQASTTTAVTSSVNPSNANQSVTFTATVSPVAPGAGVPTGTVQFMDGASALGTPQTLVSGQATYTTSTLSVAVHAITAVYSGDGSFSGSTSSVLNQTVNGADVAVTMMHAPGMAHMGGKLTFTATVVNNGPSSTNVTFTESFVGANYVVSANTTQGSCNVASGSINCNLGLMTNGASAMVTVVLTPIRLTRTIVATATATGDVTDSNTANNTATDTANVRFMPWRR